MDINSALQASQTASAIKLNNASAREINAKADEREMDNQTKKLFGQRADTAEANNRFEKAKAEGKMLYGRWANIDGGAEWDGKAAAGNRQEQMLLNEYTVNEIERKLSEERDKVRKEKVAYELMNAKLDAELKEANRNLTKEQERKRWHRS